MCCNFKQTTSKKRHFSEERGLEVQVHFRLYLHHFEFIVRRPSVLDHVIITSVQYDLVDESAQLLQCHLAAGPSSAENEKSINKRAQNISMV